MNYKEPSHSQYKRFYKALCDLQVRSDFEKQLQTAQKHMRSVLERVVGSLDDMHPARLSCGLLGPVGLDKIHEPVHTRLIAWFLNPKESHGFNTTIVSALLKHTDDFFRSGQIEVEMEI